MGCAWKAGVRQVMTWVMTRRAMPEHLARYRTSMKRYERLAQEIRSMMASGSLGPGMRLPTVRQAQDSFGVSANTVFQAYYLLEGQGLIHSVPRSGYFVSDHEDGAGAGHDALMKSAASSDPSESSESRNAVIALDEMVFEVLDSLRMPATIRFGSAFPDESLFPLARLGRSMSNAIRSMQPSLLTAEMSPGSEVLRQMISQRYLTRGMKVHHDEIVVTDGALEALNLCLESVTSPGDTVAIESPCFYGVLQSLQRLGLRAVEIPVDPVHGLDLDALAQAIEVHRIAACWFMPTFHNPTGATLSSARKKTLVAMLAAQGIPLIEDDVYADLHFGGTAMAPAKAFDVQGDVLHCSSFSKSLAPGFRIGWVTASKKYRDKIRKTKLMTTIAACVPAQLALADYLQHGHFEKHLRTLRRALSAQNDSFVAAILALFPAGTQVSRPAGGYFVWVTLPPGTPAVQLAQQCHAEGISLMPGPVFSASSGFGHCVRINTGHQWNAQQEIALRRVAALAHQCQKK
jgi:DNA-binding transcriptional MocR family regulator